MTHPAEKDRYRAQCAVAVRAAPGLGSGLVNGILLGALSAVAETDDTAL